MTTVRGSTHALGHDVPFLDLRGVSAEIGAEMTEAIARVVASGWFLLGEELSAFEREFAQYVQAPHATGVANGLDALTLALRALGVGHGDDVLVPSNTYIATWLAVTQVGARPVPVEPDPRTFNIDPARLADACTAGTRAILPVHLYGQPADMNAILAFASARDLLVVEDAAQAHGARYNGQRIGAHGDAVAWSFYPTKNLGALGDAGAVTTRHASLDDTLRVLRNYGSRVKYVNELQGTNSRLDEVQAAVLRLKLTRLDEWTARRAAQAARYTDALRDTSLLLPMVPSWAEPAWHLYVVRVPGGAADRARIQDALAHAGIGTMIHYPIAPHRQAAYANLGIAVDALPIASELADQVLSLPLGPHLTRAQQDAVIDALCAPGVC